MNKRRIRNERLQFLSSEKKNSFYTAHAGETRAVLLEKSKDENLLTGFTDNYIKVFIPSENEIVNSIVNVRLEKTNAASEMIGSVVASSR
jgi:threonylcarbamoyladenosine tRNA methylthiotransferase MtaB